MKKKVMSIVTGVAMMLSLVACGNSAVTTNTETAVSTEAAQTTVTEGTVAQAEAPEMEQLTVKEGVLMVGLEIGYPPMEYFDTDGTTPIGFDIDVSKAVAEYLGLEIEYVDTAWDGIFAGVDTEKYDVIFSSVSLTEARQEQFNMTKPYVSNHTVLIVPKDSEIDSMEALSGHSTAVQAETTSDDYMKENGPALGVELFQYDKVINCFDDLKAGRTDSVFTDSVVAAYYLGEDVDQYITVWENEELEPVSACLKKGNDALTEKIDEALDALSADGTLAKIAEAHFGTDLSAGLR